MINYPIQAGEMAYQVKPHFQASHPEFGPQQLIPSSWFLTCVLWYIHASSLPPD